ncbi:MULTISPECIES: glycoside hydrolase family 32 protein [Bacillota]|jgi:beta-fructofuranosidase|uniref:Sucrose-6-phosphate hydrolase n=1 Tax=Amedibacillus hominis TaxID=2897776 RepID=A0ABS9R443_9FIRM|nr:MULTISPECIES: sucrose-6-phosphate hydrolase [Bacillota]MCH4283903.1 sucrose-6-phosphate hydrolase [Amedibacillus hominis]
MKLIDFSNHQNRLVRMEDVSDEYINYIHQTTIEDQWYPSFHIAPPHGLLNDPNGLCQIEGTYHIFYQWFPLGPVHGLKHWRHLTTKDFIHFDDYGCAMYPDDSYDLHGCYSGMVFKEGKQCHVYYTGIDQDDKANVCYGLLKQDKIDKQGVIVSLDKKITSDNFRDPCVFKKQDTYWMLVGGESVNGIGILPVYHGDTFHTFTYQGNLNLQNHNFGYMLECPNYFEQDGKGILFFSPQGIKSSNHYDYQNVFSVTYGIGDPIQNDLNFNAQTYYEMDKGFDFYAPQIFKDESGRYILFGWLGNSKCIYPSDKNNWAHMLTIPREIIVDGDRLVQEPLEELKSLRDEERQIDTCMSLKQAAFELELEVNDYFKIEILESKENYISFEMNEKDYILDRSHMTFMYNEKYGTRRYAKRLIKENQKIRIFVDHSSIEIFADEGKTVFTSRFYLNDIKQMKVVNAKGKYWSLKSIEIENC